MRKVEAGMASSECDIIETSLEALAERAGDPTAEVYRRLFARYPETEALFVRDQNGSVRGEMLAKIFECAMDLAGPNTYAANFIRCEVVNHEGVGVPRDLFPRFFDIAVDTFRDLMGEAWTPEFDRAWRSLADRMETLAETA
jgi:hemoglobin-like flavoprotein